MEYNNHNYPCPEAVAAFITAGGVNGRKLPTLGKRSDVIFGNDINGLFCETSRGNKMSVKTEYIQSTCERFEDLLKQNQANSLGTPLHLATGQYTRNAWDKCPHYRICPYLVAIIAHLAGFHP
jgi:hypothetical protein